MADVSKKTVLKQKIKRELIEYGINFAYLAVFFASFTWYRRFILAEYHITYLHYGVAVFEALILAKLILLGNVLGLGRGLEHKPLVYPTVYRAVVFAIFVGLFAILEHAIGGLLHGKGLAGGLAELWSAGKDELLARCMVTFFAFIPYFAFRELERVFGEGKILRMFFRRSAAS
jgi:hypothetical protein